MQLLLSSVSTNTSSKVPISFGVIVTSLVLAFSTFVRSFLALVCTVSWTYFVTSTRIYGLWIEWKVDSQSLTELQKKYVKQMKEKAKREKRERHEDRESRKEDEIRRREAEKVTRIRAATKHLSVRTPPGQLPV